MPSKMSDRVNKFSSSSKESVSMPCMICFHPVIPGSRSKKMLNLNKAYRSQNPAILVTEISSVLVHMAVGLLDFRK